MNLILLHPKDYIDEHRVRLNDYRQQHVRHVHRAVVGDSLRVGDLNGKMGTGRVTSLGDTFLEMTVECSESPPEPVPLMLLLALPRPKVLKRVLLTATTLGIKEIVLLNSWRVDKSYWGSPALGSQQIDRQLITGLEQARDTMLPQVSIRSRFKPYVEDELAQIVQHGSAYVAHPQAAHPCPALPCDPTTDQQIILAVGPEGGFIPYEIEKLVEVGFVSVEIGERILRVETAITRLVSRLLPY
ncbi:MAG: 16S rRNA (uracil(1498)-N(3))-methyltransferase [Thermodesulfobacteriota bacterium]|nr:16S rRNA (uracil(1498)-N(3))-methyltransferase [Thermodesulfobacteriota bacterium]